MIIRPEINPLNLALLFTLGRQRPNGVVMNGETGFSYPDWRGPLQEVIRELDREKLPEKALKAEALILESLRQLQQSSNGHHERDDIVFGLSILRMIKRDRLGHPDWQ